MTRDQDRQKQVSPERPGVCTWEKSVAVLLRSLREGAFIQQVLKCLPPTLLSSSILGLGKLILNMAGNSCSLLRPSGLPP